MKKIYAVVGCECGAITVTNDVTKVQVSMTKKAYREQFKPFVAPARIDADFHTMSNCNYCTNKWGADLCACGSGKKFWQCKEGFNGCGKPYYDISSVLMGGAVEEPPAKYLSREDMNLKLKQLAYIEKAMWRMEAFMLEMKKLNELWSHDSDVALDLNTMLQPLYPFDKSFDEALIDVALWYADGSAKMVELKRNLRHEIRNCDGITIDIRDKGSDEVKEDPEEYHRRNAAEWERIASERMNEIKRLRGIMAKVIAADENITVFIKETGTEQTGGGAMVDFVSLKNLPYVLGITDDCVVAYKDMESFCGDEDSVIGSIQFPEQRRPDMVGEDAAPYVAVPPQFDRPFTIRHCVNCGQRLMVDPLDFLLNLDKDPICKACSSRDKAKEDVEEPSAPYYTKAQIQGKWICAFDTICQGWQCVRVCDPNDPDDGKPFLYDSKEDVESDDFFDKEEDFAIPAEEFIEGRKCIIGSTKRIEGVKIMGWEIK